MAKNTVTLPWHVFTMDEHCGTFQTKKAALEYARNRIMEWRKRPPVHRVWPGFYYYAGQRVVLCITNRPDLIEQEGMAHLLPTAETGRRT